MNIEDFEFSEEDEAAAEQLREKQLQADEVPVDLEGADDCGDSCTI